FTYYWPPSGGGGVQRWLKMSRFLPEFGIEPVICRPENADYPLLDETFENEVNPNLEVISVPIFEPFRAVRNLLGQKQKKGISAGFISEGRKSRLVQIMGYARGNYIIPDARKFWVRPVVKRLEEYLKQNPVSAIITTGPPHSVHFIGERLKQKTGVHWIADFRDYWSDMDHAVLFQLGDRAKRKHANLEKEVAHGADQMVVVTPTMAEFYSKLSGKKVEVVTNGFDDADFELPVEESKSQFVVGHYGTLGADRFSPVLWDVLEELMDGNPDFAQHLKIELVGPTDGKTLHYIRNSKLSEKLEYIQYTEHADAVQRMRSAGMLLLMVNNNSSAKGRLPGKIFEYLATQKPILGIGL